VAKVLASRLALVLGDLIPNTQMAFLKGRQLVDGVVVVNEVIDFAKKSANVWYSLNRWLGVMVILPPNLFLSYAMLVGSGTNKKRRKGYSLVWLAYIWVMWKMRNDFIFNNKVTVEEIVDSIQRISWQWYLHNVAKGSTLLYEWIWNPGDCMLV
jgi:hypothetical protein